MRRILVALGFAALSACAPSIEKVNREYGYVTESPPSTFPKLGDVWIIQSSLTHSRRELLCSNNQSLPLLDSTSEEREYTQSLRAESQGEVTADVNAILASALSTPAGIALADRLPQIKAVLQGGGKFAREATFTVTDVKLQKASLQNLKDSYDRLIASGQCSLAASARDFVIQGTLTATVTYDIKWDASLDASAQAELAELAKAKLSGNMVFDSSKKISGSGLVYGVRLLDPENPTRLVTAATLGLVGVRQTVHSW